MGSNHQPVAYRATALPIELRQHLSCHILVRGEGLEPPEPVRASDLQSDAIAAMRPARASGAGGGT